MQEHKKIKPRNFFLAVLLIVASLVSVQWMNKHSVATANAASVKKEITKITNEPIKKKDKLMYSALTCLFAANRDGGSHEEQKAKSDSCYAKEQRRINGTPKNAS